MNVPSAYVADRLGHGHLHCVYSYADMAIAIREGKAKGALYDAPVLEYVAAIQNCECAAKGERQQDCGFVVVGNEGGDQEYGYALPKNSQLGPHLSAAITHFRMQRLADNSNEYLRKRLHDKHFTAPGQCGLVSAGDNLRKKRIGITGVAGPMIGAVIGAFLILLQRVCCRAASRRSPKKDDEEPRKTKKDDTPRQPAD